MPKRVIVSIKQLAKEINSKKDWSEILCDNSISSLSKLELYGYLKVEKPEVL